MGWAAPCPVSASLRALPFAFPSSGASVPPGDRSFAGGGTSVAPEVPEPAGSPPVCGTSEGGPVSTSSAICCPRPGAGEFSCRSPVEGFEPERESGATGTRPAGSVPEGEGKTAAGAGPGACAGVGDAGEGGAGEVGFGVGGAGRRNGLMMLLTVSWAWLRSVSLPAAAPPATPREAATASVVNTPRFFLACLRDQSSNRVTFAVPGRSSNAASSAEGCGISVTRRFLISSSRVRSSASSGQPTSASSPSTQRSSSSRRSSCLLSALVMTRLPSMSDGVS